MGQNDEQNSYAEQDHPCGSIKVPCTDAYGKTAYHYEYPADEVFVVFLHMTTVLNMYYSIKAVEGQYLLPLTSYLLLPKAPRTFEVRVKR